MEFYFLNVLYKNKRMKTTIRFLLICMCFTSSVLAQKQITITGKIVDINNHKPLSNTVILIQNSNYGTTANQNGFFTFQVPYKKHFTVLFKLLGYTTKVKEIEISDNKDSIYLNVSLLESPTSLDTFTVYSKNKPDTLVGAPTYSIYDFEFYEDLYILLTAQNNLQQAELKLANNDGKIITTYTIPKEAGIAKEFYKDYLGYNYIICENYIYKIYIYNNRFILFPLVKEEVNAFIKPIIDTINGKLIFSDYWKDYPLFNYYSYNEKDSIKNKIHTVENQELMHAYNFEYYSLMPKEKLAARRLAIEYKTDKHIMASLISGFTKSMFYEPLYAPLYIIKDTICIFDHYKDKLYHINKNGIKLDSVDIQYNHPKNWKEWKNTMIKDDIEDLIYAVYEKNGHKYIKLISNVSGKEVGKYTLQFHSAEKLKIHNGYAYYIYRPFESTQKKFFYREFITLENKK